MSDMARFSYHAPDERTLMPFIPVFLEARGQRIPSAALLDSGATVNVFPRFIGTQLNLNWDDYANYQVELGGVLKGVQARYVPVNILLGSLPPTKLIFAWAQTDEVPFILGNMNFFQKFDVCFSRLRNEITVRVAKAAK